MREKKYKKKERNKKGRKKGIKNLNEIYIKDRKKEIISWKKERKKERRTELID